VTTSGSGEIERVIRFRVGRTTLEASWGVPEGARAAVLFAHGSGSSRHSPRNRHVAAELRGAGLATLLLDLLTPDEEAIDARTGHLRFDIDFLADRLLGATEWLTETRHGEGMAIGYFGASTGAAAALVAAAERPDLVRAVVSRGGRPDLARSALARVRAPTLLIVGGRDLEVIELNREAYAELEAPKRMELVPGATHLFEEPGALEHVSSLARDWFIEHLGAAAGGRLQSRTG
jgi:putative phosphoribosyl transferase